MNRVIRLHVHIDHIRVTGAELAHKHELAQEIETHLRAILRETGAGFDTPHRIRLAAVSAEPLSYQGVLRPAQVGERIARQVARTIAPDGGQSAGGDSKKTGNGGSTA